MALNGISTLLTKELRQKAKLDLAAVNRAADGNPRATYDITQLPTVYSGNVVVDNPNAGGLIEGRPWIDAPPSLVSFDGSSLSGWTTADGTPTVTGAQGNPAPSWQVTSRGFWRDLGINYLDKTIAFDVRPSANCDVGISWAQNASGTGAYRGQLRIRQSATATLQGLTLTDNGGWLYIGNAGNETAALFPTADIWYNIKVRIAANRVCTWTLNGALQASTITLPVGYTSADTTNDWFGFITNTTTAQFDNLVIYDGIV